MSIVLTKPTACIYNGCRLPVLDFLDKYPYVLICKENVSEYELYCSSSPITIEADDDGDYLLVREAPHCIKYYTQYDKTWRLTSEYTSRSSHYISSLGAPIWSSHKIAYPNGTVYISASNEPLALYEGYTEEDDDGIDLYSFTVGLVFGLSDDLSLIENSMFEDDDYVPPAREPVAYLYNGVKLPPLPEWDKEAYPFALIIKGVDEENYWIYASAEKAYYADGGPITYDLPCVRFYYYPELFPEKDYWTSMTLGEENPYRFGGLFYDMIWSNHGILRSDGSVYFAATEPVPVYE